MIEVFQKKREYDAIEKSAYDALCDWRHIRSVYGDLDVVGWDCVEKALSTALAARCGLCGGTTTVLEDHGDCEWRGIECPCCGHERTGEQGTHGMDRLRGALVQYLEARAAHFSGRSMTPYLSTPDQERSNGYR